jgi:RNA-directed DNA polymerase
MDGTRNRKSSFHRKRRGLGKPETFDFLGFTHLCGKTSRGRFTVLRQTIRKRLQARLQAVKTELRLRMHDPIPLVGVWLKSLVGGHIRYFGVRGNRYALAYFRLAVSNLWHHVLRRRSQRRRVKWERMKRLIQRWLPPAHICHPDPTRRLRVNT